MERALPQTHIILKILQIAKSPQITTCYVHVREPNIRWYQS